MEMATEWEAKGSYVFEGSDCIGICDTDNASQKVYAERARKMAAAPELLAALKAIRETAEDANHKSRIVRARAAQDIIRWADAAIAKAESPNA
jgi:hypothetical protein